MAEFLSPGWMAEVEAAAPPVDPEITFAVRQRVTGGPAGDVEYIVEIRAGRLHLRPPTKTETVDLTLTLPYPVSVALAAGELSVHDAILEGAIKMGGDLTRLQAASGALATLSDAMAVVREHTQYRR